MSLVIEVDQLKAEQAAAVQHEGLIDAPEPIAAPPIQARRASTHRGSASAPRLTGQTAAAASLLHRRRQQHRAHCVMPGHQRFQRGLHPGRLQRATEVHVAADVVQRRITATQLIQPDIQLRSGQRIRLERCGRRGHRRGGNRRHKILLR
jgi:hypothetical protein